MLSSDRLEITTDDERIVLYYIIRNNVRKVSKDMVRTWLYTDEIFEVNIDNAFDLLSSVGGDYGCTKAFSHGIIVGKCRSKCRAPVFEPVRGILVTRSKWQLLILIMFIFDCLERLLYSFWTVKKQVSY